MMDRQDPQPDAQVPLAVLDHAGSPVGGDVDSPLRQLLSLAAPTVLQMASYTLMQFADTYMLAIFSNETGSRSAEPTAAANAGLLAFALMSVGWGTVAIVNALVSQSFGQRDYRNCGRYLWQGVWFAVAYGVLMLPLLPVARYPFAFFGHEPRLVELQASYLQITVGWSIFRLLGAAFSQFLLAINRPNLVLVAALAGVSVNIFFNWLLIFGNWGFPRLGLAGAAWGTNLAVLVETGLLVVFTCAGRIRETFNALDWSLRKPEMRTFLRIGLPSGFQLVADVLAWSLFGVWVMALLDTPTMAAHNFMMRYMVVSFMPAFGLATAVTALVGRYIGMGRHDIAEQRAHLGFKVCAAYMLTCGLLFFVGRYWLIGLLAEDPEIRRIGAMLLIFAAVYQFFDAVYIIYVGALRGAGDTFVPALMTAVLCWGITVGGGLLVAKWFPHWGAAGPWTVATCYGIVLGVFMYGRFRRGRWKLIRLEAGATAPTLSDLEAAMPVAAQN